MNGHQALSESVQTRREQLIASEVNKVVMAHRTMERVDTEIARLRHKHLEAQETVAVTCKVLGELFGLSDAEVTDLITNAKRSKRRLDDDDDEDDDG